MSRLRAGLIFIIVLVAIFVLIVLAAPHFSSSGYNTVSYTKVSEVQLTSSTQPKALPVTHLKTPNPLKAIYMTACVAGTPSWRNSLKNLIETTELNAVVIDIKDYTGAVSFTNDFPKISADSGLVALPGCVVADMREFIEDLHDANIYVIGRISVFQDPSYAKLFPELAVKKKSDGGIWKDYKGLSFIDVGARPYWDYIVEISKQAYALGFDELNYDYVRYPSDGNMQDVFYSWTPSASVAGMTASSTNTASSSQLSVSLSKSEMLESFFEYLRANLDETGAVLSADLFGMTTTVENDMGIGQILELALPHFDYIAPMVYPSHYPRTWSGFANPAEHPYEVIKIAMSRGVEREQALNILNGLATSTPSKLRPWLQDFNLGATYGEDKVRAQIQATYDVGLTSWMLWSAGNKYTTQALMPAEE